MNHVNSISRYLLQEEKGNEKKYNIERKEFIHIGLTIDPYSIKDAMILINSILLSAINTENLFFHLVTGEKTMEAAEQLKKDLNSLIQQCYVRSFTFQYEIKPFLLPETSGFKLQLMTKLIAKNTKSHWNSPIGTDMMRFYLPSLFPTVPKILYLDNDIIVTCCIEEVYFTSLEHSVIGIALDDLHWATITQFKRHYNASHPLIIKHMRNRKIISPPQKGAGAARGSGVVSMEAIQDDEFYKSVPRYPNDGVILFNVSAYQFHHILEDLNEIASVNSQDYVINIGTQQFTVLTLHDRWIELTPRANLRHFPNMARGYLMWFYYHGFIHYAGMFKPKGLCGFETFKENHLRVMTYSAFLFSNYFLHEQCFNLPISSWSMSLTSSFQSASAETDAAIASTLKIPSMTSFTYDTYFHSGCLNTFVHNHLLESLTLYEFLMLLRTILTRFNDESYVYVYIGADVRPMRLIQQHHVQRQKHMQEQAATNGGAPPVTADGATTTPPPPPSYARQWDYQEYRQIIDEKYKVPSMTSLKDLNNYSFLKTFQEYVEKNTKGKDTFYEDLKASCSPQSSFSLIQLIHQMVLFDSNWSFRVFHSFYSQLISRFYTNHHRSSSRPGPGSRAEPVPPNSNRRSLQQSSSSTGGGQSNWQHLLKSHDPNRYVKDEYQWLYQSLQTIPKTSKFYQNIALRDDFQKFHQFNPQTIYNENFDYETGKKKKKSATLPSNQERSFFIQSLKICYKPILSNYLQNANLSLLRDISFQNPMTMAMKAQPSLAVTPSDSSSQLMKVSNEGCHDILQELKWEGKRHWDIMGLVMNVMSLEEMELILNGMDLIFMRPKFIFLEFRFLSTSSSASGTDGTSDDLVQFEPLLKRMMSYMKKIGYLANHNYPLVDSKSDSSGSSDGKKKMNGKERIQCSRKDGKIINFVYLWAVRVNLLEITE